MWALVRFGLPNRGSPSPSPAGRCRCHCHCQPFLIRAKPVNARTAPAGVSVTAPLRCGACACAHSPRPRDRVQEESPSCGSLNLAVPASPPHQRAGRWGTCCRAALKRRDFARKQGKTIVIHPAMRRWQVWSRSLQLPAEILQALVMMLK